VELFDILSKFLNDKSEMKLLQTVDDQAFVSYLTDIFEKLNVLNKQLQGANKTVVHAKAETFGIIAFLQLCQKNVSAEKLNNFMG
jgi:roadblock/LC7 domain-containing protein